MRFIAVVSLLVLVHSVSAQVSLTVEADRERYIAYEPVEMTVTVRNDTGNRLYFGEKGEYGALRLVVTNLRGEPVGTLTGKVNPAAGLLLPTGARKSITVPINSYFNVKAHGDYEVRARLTHRRLPTDFLSERVFFQVRDGAPLWERTVGMPVSTDSAQVIPMRHCSVNVFHSDGRDICFLRIQDDDYVYATVRLGPRVKSVDPQCEVDARSRIHILMQVEPRFFRYLVYDLNGELEKKAVYMAELSGPQKLFITRDDVPHLIRDPDIGRVMVSGGRVAVDGVDYNIEKTFTGAGAPPPHQNGNRAATGEGNAAPPGDKKTSRKSLKERITGLFRRDRTDDER